MKTIKLTIFSILGATLLGLGLYSCSNDDTTGVNELEKTNVSKNANRKTGNSNSLKYITNYYNTEFDLKNTIEVEDDVEPKIFSKFKTSTNENIDFYIIEDITTNKVEYIVELDKKNLTLTNIDILNNETQKIDDLTIFEDLENYNYELDDYITAFLFGIKFPIFDGDRFWGQSCEKTIRLNPLTGEEDGCDLSCRRNILWTDAGDGYDGSCNAANAPKNPKIIAK